MSHKEGEPLALQFTAMGYHAAVLTYSVKPAVYPTQLLEIAQAWKIIRENADRWNVLTDKIIIMGGSALYAALWGLQHRSLGLRE